MQDKCPTCDRKFQQIEDYPLIYVAGFKREEIPTNIKFPYHDWTVFVGPNAKQVNERPPQEVIEFFKANKKSDTFDYDGWKWTKEGKWDTGHYNREHEDQRGIIIAELDPYLDSLDSFVGNEISKDQILPQFPRDGMFRYAFNIPNTDYQIMFSEEEKTQNKLRIAKLELMGEGMNLGSAGGPTIQGLATIGKLEYEGRIYNPSK